MKNLHIPKIPLKQKISISKYTTIFLVVYAMGFLTSLLELCINYQQAMMIESIVEIVPLLIFAMGLFLPLESMDEFFANNIVHSFLLSFLFNIIIYVPLLSLYICRGIIKGRWESFQEVSIKNPMLIVQVISATVLLLALILFLYYENRKDRKYKIASKVAFYRERAGMDQKEFAELTGLRVKTVEKLEKGIYKPGIVTSIKISKVLLTDVSELFPIK